MKTRKQLESEIELLFRVLHGGGEALQQTFGYKEDETQTEILSIYSRSAVTNLYTTRNKGWELDVETDPMVIMALFAEFERIYNAWTIKNHEIKNDYPLSLSLAKCELALKEAVIEYLDKFLDIAGIDQRLFGEKTPPG